MLQLVRNFPEDFGKGQCRFFAVSASHLRMVPVGTYVEATGRLIHRGRTSHLWNVDITTPDGKLVSTARIVNQIVKKRP